MTAVTLEPPWWAGGYQTEREGSVTPLVHLWRKGGASGGMKQVTRVYPPRQREGAAVPIHCFITDEREQS